jgi:hypothetical protein
VPKEKAMELLEGDQIRRLMPDPAKDYQPQP